MVLVRWGRAPETIESKRAGDLTIITIDGPAASGKTSVSRELARRHGWDWVSTGAFYRGLAYVALEKGVNLEDEQALADLCLDDSWSVRMTEETTLVYLGDLDVTAEIFREETGNAASKISSYPKVRQNLLEAQRNCATEGQWMVAEGRDCGTVVFPTARVKIYLTARQESRAARRAQEQGKSLEETQKLQKIRDHQDSSRKAAPMQAAEDALIVDTSTMNLQEVVDHVDGLVRKELEL